LKGGCGHINEHSGSINGGKFLDHVNAYYLLEKDSAPWSFHDEMIY
jgi:hypothetical protein